MNIIKCFIQSTRSNFFITEEVNGMNQFPNIETHCISEEFYDFLIL